MITGRNKPRSSRPTTKPTTTKPKTQADYKEIRTGRPISRYTPTKPKTKPTGPTITKPKVAPSPNTPGGNIGRTLTKYDGKARVAPKPQDNTKKKKKYGKSGMGMEAYQRRTGSKR